MFPQIRTKLIANFFLQFSNQYDSYDINYVGIILDTIVRWNKWRWVDQFFSPLYDDFSFCNFVVPVSRTKWNFVRDSFHHFVCKAESSAIVRKNSICGLVSMYCGKVRAIVIDYFSCNPIAKPTFNAIHDIVVPSIADSFQKNPVWTELLAHPIEIQCARWRFLT